jgi:hypothetical protein
MDGTQSIVATRSLFLYDNTVRETVEVVIVW